jgi:CDP-paratose 2-epimerase
VEQFCFILGDVRDGVAVAQAARHQQVNYHLAAQVAVTTSVTDPRHDFVVNALGTFNVLEAARRGGEKTILLFASTNKVHGGMEDLAIVEGSTRFGFHDLSEGIDEIRPSDFHSPYGCSKGAAHQRVRDYARIYGLRSVVFRMSCI